MARPFKYNNKELNNKINEYFDSICYVEPMTVREYERDETGNKIKDDDGKYIFKEKYVFNKLGEKIFKEVYVEPPTVSGLAYYIGTNRQTLINYENKDEFIDTIKSCKARLTKYYEQRMIENGHAGNIFAAKNFGFTDKVEVEHNVKRIVIQDE